MYSNHMDTNFKLNHILDITFVSAVDGLSRFVFFMIPIKGAPTAVRVARAWYEEVCAKHSIPRQTVTDKVCHCVLAGSLAVCM